MVSFLYLKKAREIQMATGIDVESSMTILHH